MGQTFERLDDRLRAFIADQPMFFVATAPRDGGHVNVSPKGYADTFTVIDDHTVAYLDLYGSGSETIAHLRDNGRITLMFCSFGRTPKILRLYGTGTTVRPDDAEWPDLARRFGGGHAGMRMIIVVSISRIADSCGFAVPYLELAGERPMLDDRHARRKPEEWPARVTRNTTSIDGLPALGPDHPVPPSSQRTPPAASPPRAHRG